MSLQQQKKQNTNYFSIFSVIGRYSYNYFFNNKNIIFNVYYEIEDSPDKDSGIISLQIKCEVELVIMNLSKTKTVFYLIPLIPQT